MSILASLSWGRTATQVVAALEAARATGGPVLVAGAPGLARVLADRGLAAQGLDQPAAVLPVADGTLAALIVRGGPAAEAEWRRALRPGGAVVLVDGPPAAEQSRRALCAGLVDLEQRRAGRLVVTSGRTWAG